MTSSNYLKKSLKLEEYFDGVERILRYLSSEQLDDTFLTAKAAELQTVATALFGLVGAEPEASIGIREKSFQLTNEVGSLRLLLKSHAKSGVTSQGSVAYLQGVMARYDVFVRKNAARKITDAKALVRDFGTAEAQPHVTALEGVQQKLADISAAADALSAQQAAVANAKANPTAKASLGNLKDQAKVIVNAIGDYLKGMSLSDADHYADHYNLFSAIIESANQPAGLSRKAADGSEGTNDAGDAGGLEAGGAGSAAG